MKLFGEKVKCVENYLVTKLENLRINRVLFDVLILTTLTTLGTVEHNRKIIEIENCSILNSKFLKYSSNQYDGDPPNLLFLPSI